MDDEYSYFEINYISCEGNSRWTIVRCPLEWDEYDLRRAIQMGGVGDDPAEITSITPACSSDYDYGADYTS